MGNLRRSKVELNLQRRSIWKPSLSIQDWKPEAPRYHLCFSCWGLRRGPNISRCVAAHIWLSPRSSWTHKQAFRNCGLIVSARDHMSLVHQASAASLGVVFSQCACRIVVENVLFLMWILEGLNPGCHYQLFQASSIYSDAMAFVYYVSVGENKV